MKRENKKTYSEKMKYFLLIFLKNIYKTSINFNRHSKRLISFIVVKVHLVAPKSHIFLKENSQKY